MRNKTTVISHRFRLQTKCYVIYQVLSCVFIGYPIAYIGLSIYNDVRRETNCFKKNIPGENHANIKEIHQILKTLQSSLFHRSALRNNNQCHRSGISAAAAHADQNPFCRSTGKNHFCADSYYNRPFGSIYHTDCVQVLCDICGAHDGSEDGARHEKGAFRPI